MKSAEYFITNTQLIFFVPRPGVEPGWMLLHWCLRPARLPIPPSGQLFWATVSLNCGAKVSHFSDTHKFWKTFSLLKPEKILFEKRLSSPNRTGEFIRMK